MKNILNKEVILQQLKNNLDLITQNGVSQIGLFGSYNIKKQTENSDIDILVDFYPASQTYHNFLNTCDLLQSLFLNHKVEVVTKNGLSQYMRNEILNSVHYV